MAKVGLWRLIYVSRNAITGDDDEVRAEIEQILVSARRANAEQGITGALLFNEAHFAQVLEGGHAEVLDTFARIQDDARHTDVQLLDLSRIDERVFPRWSMAYEAVSADAVDRFSDIAVITEHDDELLEGDLIFELVRLHFAEVPTILS